MRYTELEGSGDIICLICDTKLVYKNGADCSCKCNNLTVFGTNITDKSGHHAYSVIPQFYKKYARRTIIVDIDKTLCLTNKYPYLGELNSKLVGVLKQLHESGMTIVASSCRMNPRIVGGDQEAVWHSKQIREFLNFHGLHFILLSTVPKQYGTLTIDDKSTSYQPLIDLFERLQIFGKEKALDEYLNRPDVHTGE